MKGTERTEGTERKSGRALGLFVPRDIGRARELAAACGHAAFAALTGRTVEAAMMFFPAHTWVNFQQMQDALDAVAESNYIVAIQRWPTFLESGIVMLQIMGPWTEIGVPYSAGLKHTHWVAVRDGHIFDINADKWLSEKEWCNRIQPEIVERTARATGIGPRRAFCYQAFVERGGDGKNARDGKDEG